MGLTIRKGLFETNSSSTHSVSIHMWDFSVNASIEEDECPDDIYLDEWALGWILANIPTDELEKELHNRKSNEDN